MTATTTEPIKTPFYDYHVAAGAKMIEFAGYMMPVQYTSIVAEHRAVRSNIGLFDLSHMGEFEVRGSDATAFLQKVTTNNCEKLQVGEIQYSCMTLPGFPAYLAKKTNLNGGFPPRHKHYLGGNCSPYLLS